MNELKSSEDWSKEYPDVIIMDPDGWDRSPEGWDKSWNEKISRAEFESRLIKSTCQFSPGHIKCWHPEENENIKNET